MKLVCLSWKTHQFYYVLLRDTSSKQCFFFCMLVFGGGCIYNGYKDDFSKMTKGIVKKIQKGIEQDERKQGTLLTY